MTGPAERCTHCGGTGFEMVFLGYDRREEPGACAICEGTGAKLAGDLKVLLVRLTEARTGHEQASLIRAAVRLACGRKAA